MKWRELYYYKIANTEELKSLISDGIETIFQILITLDTDEIKEQLRKALLNGDIKKLQKLREKIPFYFDSVGYPIIRLLLLKNKIDNYFIIVGENAEFTRLTVYDKLKGNLISVQKFEPLMLIYPI
mgnify:CR=1 FL=1